MKLTPRIYLSLASLLSSNVFAQSIGLGGSGFQNKNIYLSSQLFKSKESHYDFGVKIPIWKNETDTHDLSINSKSTNLENQDIKSQFDSDHFYTTNIGWTYKKSRERGKYLPWSGTFSYHFNGNDFLEKGRENLSFRLMTGHISGSKVHIYGAALSSSGAFKGVPFPFYVFTTRVWNQNLTIGFPFIGLSGPKKNKTNYSFSLSPLGISLKGAHQLNQKTKLHALWGFSVDNYIFDSSSLNEKESLLIEKQKIQLGGTYKIQKLFSLNLTIGQEYNRRYFKGENIFKKDDLKHEMKDSTFVKTGLSFKF